ncbi:MAG TPA: Zn-dependent alcohol dehydrogenase [Casimicrobiaceae bacterium]|nr:Zn-dependent alcohol dehydrogenase [Casimicrobiaceae bacterium]
MRFRAAVLHEIGKPLVIERVQCAPLHPGDVLVRVRASGLCHTDLEVMHGTVQRPVPTVLGHEGAGVVEAVGTGVTRVKRGEHVICSWNPSCGHCFYCDQDLPILCEAVSRHYAKGWLLDGTSRLALDGTTLHHFSMVSSHAEYCVVPEAGAVPVPTAIPFDRACLIGCAVMTGFGAATHIAPVTAGANVLVVGCGPVGLSVIQAAAIHHAGRIIAVDPDASRREVARAFGATELIDGHSEDAAGEVRAMTRGRGADVSFEAAGQETAMQLALEAARPGAHVVLLGKVPVDHEVAFRFGALMGEKRLIRSSYGGARPWVDFPMLARLYLDGTLKLDEMITQRLPLDAINQGFDAMRRGATIRSVVVLE